MNRFLVLLVSLSSILATADARVTVAKVFGDHMVLQREMPVPIWGTADPGESVTVQFRKQSKSAVTDEEGNWMVRLEALALGEAAELIVSSSVNEVRFQDVLVGEVWIGSGQSNMAGAVRSYAKNDPVLSKAVADGPYPKIRGRNIQGWKMADTDGISGFSAIHFSFGLNLHHELGVPIGLMLGAVGGTPSGLWLNEAMVEADPALMAMLKKEGGYPDMAALRAANESALAEWKIKADQQKAAGEKPSRFPGPIIPGGLYGRYIEYMVPYAIRGVLWDQGESRTRIPGADQYTVMHALISGWREVWGQGDFPFLHVQKPSGGFCAWNPDNPINRGALDFDPTLPDLSSGKPINLDYPIDHIKIGTLKNAPLVPISDMGVGVHPTNKSGYGQRAAQVAMGTFYGSDVAVSGPVYRSHKIEGDSIRVSFDHVGSGLACRHADDVRGFAVAGADGKWAWADAVIDGKTVVVSSPEVPQPTAVRYGFSKTAPYANLFNQEELPTLMFSTSK